MRFSEDKLATLVCSDHVKRPIHIWEPKDPKAVILAIHGGMAHAGDYVTPALYFKAHGIATVSFDMCGHDGKKRVDIPGFQIFLDDQALFLKWIKATYPGLPIYVMGHSMGALIATHLEFGSFSKDRDIKGYIVSSPYYVNAIKVSRILESLSRTLAKVGPTMKVPLEHLTHLLTHDADITARHLADERDNIRATEITFRFAVSLMKAQEALPKKFDKWGHPVFAVVAGDDALAEAQGAKNLLHTIPSKFLEYHHYAENYHENFNEINRNKIFGDILNWMNKVNPAQG